ncbi:putative membrane protein [Clostridium argentinense CDC 2741]|uniref:Putative membrane protein n=1 Tax=Clostridium argentinense CDC 2741 TaxID=1418104 RepID=A0A0C1UDR8_9CLOT|nr:putative membrane protein [Clostridium argentinense CDC 2741]
MSELLIISTIVISTLAYTFSTIYFKEKEIERLS